MRLVAALSLLTAVVHAADLNTRKPLLPSAPLAHKAPSTDLIAGKAMPEPAAPLTKGYLAILGGVMIHLVCGSLYCWGNLVTYMPASLKYWSPEGGEGPSDAGLVLAFTLLSQMCGMPFGPLFESLVGPRLTALLGGAMMASGLWLASSATDLTQFVLSYAVLFGLGIGLSYQMPFITGGRWFPGKKGSVQGVVMTRLGSSAFVARRGVAQGIALAAALPWLAASADDDAALAPLPPPPPPMKATDISYEELKVKLIECKDPELCTVERVAFLSAKGEEADVVLKSGERLPIIGIPQENPSNDSSPAKLIAKLRDSKVPFSFPFTDALKKR